MFTPRRVETVLQQAQKNAAYRSTFLVSFRDKFIPVNVSDIGLFYISENGVKLKTKTGEEYYLSYSLDQLELMVSPQHFFRANRQYLVAHGAVSEIENHDDRKLLLRMNVPLPGEIVISKAKASAFVHWMGALRSI
jgi:DNA-binding LytR/AlgR family response regulator